MSNISYKRGTGLTSIKTSGNLTGSGISGDEARLKDDVVVNSVSASLFTSSNGNIILGNNIFWQDKFGSNNLLFGTYCAITNEETDPPITGSFVHGYQVAATVNYSHAEGYGSQAKAPYSHAEGSGVTNGELSHAEGFATTASGSYSHAEGEVTVASGSASHAEGAGTITIGAFSHAEGQATIASGDSSHAEGYGTVASNNYSHAEGENNIASGYGSHAEGNGTVAFGELSHAEGVQTVTSGAYSHAEGFATITSGSYSHTEGIQTVASGAGSHAEGNGTITIGAYSHAEGVGTIASSSYQHVQGKYNQTSSTAIAIIGNGTDGLNRSNIVEVYTDRMVVSGSLFVTSAISCSDGITGSYSGSGTNLTNLSASNWYNGAARWTTDVRNQFSAGSGLTYDAANGIYSLTNTSVSSSTSDVTLSTQNLLLCSSSLTSSTISAQLPLTSDVPSGRTYVVKNTGVGTVNILASGSNLIDGQATASIRTTYSSYTVVGTGSNWWII
jgi:hypothetical protein